MTLIESAVVFLASWIVGGIGIYAGTLAVTGKADYGDALLTALLGALIWSIVSFFVGFIPLLGPVLTFLAWLAVINSRTKGGWINALLVSLIAWIAVIVVLTILATVGISSFEAIGIPGV